MVLKAKQKRKSHTESSARRSSRADPRAPGGGLFGGRVLALQVLLHAAQQQVPQQQGDADHHQQVHTLTDQHKTASALKVCGCLEVLGWKWSGLLGWKWLGGSGVECLDGSARLGVDWTACLEVLGWKWIGLLAEKCLG